MEQSIRGRDGEGGIAQGDAPPRRRAAGDHKFVVAASRLPVDRAEGPDGEAEWRASPGGLVTALEPVMRQAGGAWVGWPGAADDAPEPFDAAGMHLVSVCLSAEEVSDYYEGFCNATLWPLYHDVIAQPEFHREWWDAYVRVNRRYAEAVADQAAIGATVWVHDYQLQLVPGMLRQMRSDVRIGHFTHIPFPGYEIFAQLPWRRQIVQGLLGADLLGFQRRGDATNFLRASRRAAGLATSGSVVHVREGAPAGSRDVRAAAFPISIDSAAFGKIARQPDVIARSHEIREALGNPKTVMLGIDRLDYTKGILHRLNAYGELLDEGRLGPPETVLVQVASPSRERVEHYKHLRDEVEVIVGRNNGEHSELGYPAIQYLHQSYPREEMAALYLAADVMLVTPLRDGMNLVAKEYVACRHDETGALVLSEFTGAADELTSAFIVNPHDIEGMKDAIVRAATITPAEARRRMRSMRRRVLEHDVAHWATTFLDALDQPKQQRPPETGEAELAGASSRRRMRFEG
ncbi:MAG TPA: trehalose-6-phosphate synthase [Streptosporangiaceae bacterium]|nr:trehalose-6-phosphate synthase [Streptosporangiaceae bacterium]